MSHNANQAKPSAPETRKAYCQPKRIVIQGIKTAASPPPTLEPLSNIATAKPRSPGGNHSATALLAPGQLTPSPMPRRKRSIANDATEWARLVAIPITDHQTTPTAKPIRVPIKSKASPPTSHVNA